MQVLTRREKAALEIIEESERFLRGEADGYITLAGVVMEYRETILEALRQPQDQR